MHRSHGTIFIYTLNPTPYTLHPTPYILHHTPYALHPNGTIFIWRKCMYAWLAGSSPFSGLGSMYIYDMCIYMICMIICIILRKCMYAWLAGSSLFSGLGSMVRNASGLSGMRKCQKRPIHMAKETYSYGKRGLLLLAYLRYANVNRPLLPYE